MKSYKDLDIYNLSFQYAIEVHYITIELPKYELYELGSQLRRSSKSIVSNIVEGYGRRRYKHDFIKFLVYAHASLLEAIAQLEMIVELYKNEKVNDLKIKYDALGSKIYSFIQYVEKEWKV